MRLPIEDDWKPSSGSVNMKEDEHEQHVRELAERLREANKTAGQHSKMSHDTAKRYYDRHTKVEQFKKGDYVYVHNPVHKRGKAKKFSYKYDGPFEVEQKISSLIYKVRLGDGTSTILHVNRLKRAKAREVGNGVVPEVKVAKKTARVTQSKKVSCDKRKDCIEEGVSEDVIPPPAAQVEVQDEEENENRDDPEWVPGSSYLQRKSHSSTTADNVAYRLRSRLVGRSEREAETDNGQAEAVSLQGNETVSGNARSEAPSGKNNPATSHSYNLRSRVESTSNSGQE